MAILQIVFPPLVMFPDAKQHFPLVNGSGRIALDAWTDARQEKQIDAFREGKQTDRTTKKQFTLF